MSIQAVSWAIATETPSPITKLILICLANYADADGGAFPGQKRLAADASASESSIRRGLKVLEFAGLITRHHRHRPDGTRTSDFYQLQLTTGQSDGVPCHSDAEDADYRSESAGLPVNLTGHEPSDKPSDKLASSLSVSARARENPEIVAITASEICQILGKGHGHLRKAVEPAVDAWFQDGCTRTDILDTVRTITARDIYEPPGSIHYFTAAVLETRDDRIRSTPLEPQDLTDEHWKRLMRSWEARQYWHPHYGPEPGKPGCLVPASFQGSCC